LEAFPLPDLRPQVNRAVPDERVEVDEVAGLGERRISMYHADQLVRLVPLEERRMLVRPLPEQPLNVQQREMHDLVRELVLHVERDPVDHALEVGRELIAPMPTVRSYDANRERLHQILRVERLRSIPLWVCGKLARLDFVRLVQQ